MGNKADKLSICTQYLTDNYSDFLSLATSAKMPPFFLKRELCRSHDYCDKTNVIHRGRNNSVKTITMRGGGAGG